MARGSLAAAATTRPVEAMWKRMRVTGRGRVRRKTHAPYEERERGFGGNGGDIRFVDHPSQGICRSKRHGIRSFAGNVEDLMRKHTNAIGAARPATTPERCTPMMDQYQMNVSLVIYANNPRECQKLGILHCRE